MCGEAKGYKSFLCYTEVVKASHFKRLSQLRSWRSSREMSLLSVLLRGAARLRAVQYFLTCSMSSSACGKEKKIPGGVWPTMITPFLNDPTKSVDWRSLDILIEWYINSGCTGLFSVCLSSEMFQLSNEERIAIARQVTKRAAGRMPVVAGATFEGGLEEQAGLMNEMGKYVDAVVIVTNQICGMDESDEVWLDNVRKLMDLTGDLPLGLYETPLPQVRSLTPEMLAWCAGTGRFLFHKDTSLGTNEMLKKLSAVKLVPGNSLRFFTAKVQFLKTLLDHGGDGFSGVISNFFPSLVVWMHNHRNDQDAVRERVHHFLSVADRVIAHKYPTSSKHYLAKFFEVPLQPVCRMQSVTMNDQDAIAIDALHQMMQTLSTDMDIPITATTNLP